MPRLIGSIVLLLAALLVSTASTPVAAQDALAHRSYITPFPNGDRYRVVVLGDGDADGLWSGLYRSFEEDLTVDVLNRSKKWTGFTDPKRYDWNGEIDQILNDGTYHVAVVQFGLGEHKAIRENGKVLNVGTEEWRQAYGARIETFIRKLRAAGLGVYWVGLPVMRSAGQRAAAERLNDVFREKAFVNGAKFIDTWSEFADENGQYTLVGTDEDGRTQRMRDGDGFTSRGDLKLAQLVNKELRQDIELAKKERDIPLAGDPEEQEKVATGLTSPEPAARTAAAGDPVDGEEGDALREDQVGDVSVVRPNRGASAPINDPDGDTGSGGAPDPQVITSNLPGGYTAISSISAVSDVTLSSSRPQLPLAQRPYYRVLVRGEQLEPKSGRADDFAWPPS
ncbi:hypothetical protein AUC70_14680 [Methyloceanibacter stevinii]|uniref:SGNH hydrolase-type esterase domain-containing protein n=1 Tax=Methyloceanibacter stevinii TaxID=1774970 RepID=A0A1E3VT92_9HYPH|nr:GDSL-type esterase/lipase family protein [Methyloceanibacter stevinii]ODR96521.1 hypothetical protein AUC70_14680 [Methyloceanibacter stevinii]